jgi:beta-N-acetylhexosaminidase
MSPRAPHKRTTKAVGEQTTLAERKRRAGQRLIIGIQGTGISQEEVALIREIKPAGFILFARNVEEPAQVLELNRELQSLLPPELPALCTVDQEGGRVQRIRDGATRFPPLRWVGNTQNLDLARQHAIALAQEVRAMGFHLNWAPDADVDSNPANPIIGNRSFGRNPAEVAHMVHTWILAAQETGIACAAKHFPGHGDTELDSHLELPIVEKDRPEIHEVELQPFRAAVAANVAAIMTAHVIFPAFDEHWPATLSTEILIRLLREKMGFNGLLVTDDMEMKAVCGRYETVVQLRRACEATVDVMLACESPTLQLEFFEGLIHLQETDPTRHDQLAKDSEKRLLKLRERFLIDAPHCPGLEILNSRQHTDLMALIQAHGEDSA